MLNHIVSTEIHAGVQVEFQEWNRVRVPYVDAGMRCLNADNAGDAFIPQGLTPNAIGAHQDLHGHPVDQMPQPQVDSFGGARRSTQTGCRRKKMLMIKMLHAATTCPDVRPERALQA